MQVWFSQKAGLRKGAKLRNRNRRGTVRKGRGVQSCEDQAEESVPQMVHALG